MQWKLCFLKFNPRFAFHNSIWFFCYLQSGRPFPFTFVCDKKPSTSDVIESHARKKSQAEHFDDLITFICAVFMVDMLGLANSFTIFSSFKNLWMLRLATVIISNQINTCVAQATSYIETDWNFFHLFGGSPVSVHGSDIYFSVLKTGVKVKKHKRKLVFHNKGCDLFNQFLRKTIDAGGTHTKLVNC